MEEGKNTDPQWAPDGKSLAYVSDRGGVSDVYLYDLGTGESYQLTDLFTGAQGITPLSPILSWAAKADKLAYVYYEQGEFNVYVLDNPRSLKKEPWRPAPIAVASVDSVTRPAPGADSTGGGNSAIYRSAQGFRRADSVSAVTAAQRAYAPVSIRKLMDSTILGLPGHEHLHPARLPGAFHAGLRGPPQCRIPAGQFRPWRLRRNHGFVVRHARRPPDGLQRLPQRPH